LDAISDREEYVDDACPACIVTSVVEQRCLPEGRKSKFADIGPENIAARTDDSPTNPFSSMTLWHQK
jgi:hypothetical protein